MFKFILSILILLTIFSTQAFAATDPRLNPNNKFGINTLSPLAEISEASSLVNTNGDWGYVVVTIKKSERDMERWQTFLDKLRDFHLIPIIRIATDFDSKGFWQKPGENDAREWANFLSNLYFPTKNRYIQIYNEVNWANEWGGRVDAQSYAIELNETIDALKAKSSDFFILNAPLDLALQNGNQSIEASEFFKEMENSVPGIFKKLDGWASHSYPNPDFSGSPDYQGKTGITGFAWELSEIAPYVDSKDLPVFITETGWRRGDGNSLGLSEDKISEYYKTAFAKAWNDPRIVAVAPFVLGYPEALFDQFSFKKQEANSYYKYFSTIRDLPKIKGEPVRDNLLANFQIRAPANILKDTSKEINVKFRNTGNYSWNFKKDLDIRILAKNIYAYEILWNQEETLPGQEVSAIVKIKSNSIGTEPVTIQIVDNNQILGQKNLFIKSDTSFSLFIESLQTLL